MYAKTTDVFVINSNVHSYLYFCFYKKKSAKMLLGPWKVERKSETLTNGAVCKTSKINHVQN
jgi:hypothetical protein